MRKTASVFILLLLFAPLASAKIVEDFNDGSLSDGSGTDGQWSFITGTVGNSTTVVTNVNYDGSPCMYVKFVKDSSNQWTYLLCSNLTSSPNVRNFSKYTAFSAEVRGAVKLLIKFRDSNGNETADVGTQVSQNSTGWSQLTWDISTLDWRSADKTQINAIYFFPEPGLSNSGEFWMDNLELTPDATQYAVKNLIVDDFNKGGDSDKLGGTTVLWPDPPADNRKISSVFQRNIFDAEPGQVHGRTGKSLQIWYGDTAGNMSPYNDYYGWYTKMNGKNIANYGSVSFWVNGANGNETFQFAFKDSSGREPKVDIKNYIMYKAGDAGNGMAKNAWRKVVIPFSAFTNVDFTSIDAYTFTMYPNSSGMFFIDDIVFNTYGPAMIQNFESGSFSSSNGFGGSQGSLGSGSFMIDSTAVNGAYGGKLSGDNSGFVDDFNDGSDPNIWGGNDTGNWTNGGNTIAVSYDGTTYYGSSGRSLKLAYTDGVSNSTYPVNTGMILGLNNHSIADYTQLRFMVKSTNANQKFKVGLNDGSVEAKVWISSYMIAGTSWQQAIIPLSDFLLDKPTFSKSSMSSFTIEFSTDIDAVNTSGSVYIDNLEFYSTSTWHGGWITLGGANLSAYSALDFYLKGADGTENLKVRLQDSSGESTEVDISTMSTSWESKSIPLSAMAGVNKNSVNAIHLGINGSYKTLYIDDLRFERAGVLSKPSDPTDLRNNGIPIASGSTLTTRNLLTAAADSYLSNTAMEGVRFEYSDDGSVWNTIGVDYDTDDTQYSAGWNASPFFNETGYFIRAIAQDVNGNDSQSLSVSGLSIEKTDVFVYPNPYYPNKGTGKINFVNVVTNAVLKVYTVSGELVVTLKDDGTQGDLIENDGMISWNGKNRDGNVVASGIYLYMVTKEKSRVCSGKFVVIK